ncbi:hypothetical protein Clacol_006022 [Clathrus columnatus]|uniref:Uncharacterized protein n=1 Tax=Clathrus columnatus TaxID=1419009 RepID=A0AAV5AGH2_9AGAM|nr:hypothetical protein Clacol_006022 [Clathrus columnatus]
MTLFSKFLTSPELLDSEIADTNFLRQFLFQLLIILQHLLQFTVGEKVKWTGARNRLLQMDFTVNATDEKWCHDTWTRVVEGIRATTPGGKRIAETVCAIFDRESNWKTKLEENDKNDGTTASLALSLGYRSYHRTMETGFYVLQSCEDLIGPGDLKDCVKRSKQVEMRIEL